MIFNTTELLKLLKKYIVIISILLLLFIAIIIATKIISKSKISISATITYDINLDENNKFIDNTTFIYQNIISTEFLNHVINTNKHNYNNLNAATISKSKDTKVSYDKDKNTYTLQLPLNEFKDQNQLKDFIHSIHETITNYSKDLNKFILTTNYFDSLSESKINSLTYDELFTIINYQTTLFKEDLKHFNSNYNQNNSNIIFNDIYFEYLNWYDNVFKVNNLKLEIENNYYILNIEKSQYNAKQQIYIIQSKVDLNTKTIDALEYQYKELQNANDIFISNPFLDEITKLVKENIMYKAEIDYYTKISNSSNTTDNINFKNKIYSLLNDYKSYINSFNNYYLDFLNANTKHNIFGNSEFNTNSINQSIIFILSGILILTSLVSYIYLKEKHIKEASNQN